MNYCVLHPSRTKGNLRLAEAEKGAVHLYNTESCAHTTPVGAGGAACEMSLTTGKMSVRPVEAFRAMRADLISSCADARQAFL